MEKKIDDTNTLFDARGEEEGFLNPFAADLKSALSFVVHCQPRHPRTGS